MPTKRMDNFNEAAVASLATIGGVGVDGLQPKVPLKFQKNKRPENSCMRSELAFISVLTDEHSK